MDKPYEDKSMIDYRNALKHCCLFDQKTSNPSKYLTQYVDTSWNNLKTEPKHEPKPEPNIEIIKKNKRRYETDSGSAIVFMSSSSSGRTTGKYDDFFDFLEDEDETK